jgi:NADPH-dependent ferric siderophore reductase
MISKMPKWVGDLLERSIGPNVRVLDSSYISPQIKKIRFQGSVSQMNLQIGYANVIRVSETEYRNYTVAFHDEDRAFFDMIIHIHGNGAGSAYIDNLQADDTLFISSARGRREYDHKVKQYVIFGDETSLGLACSFFPALERHNHQYQFYFELDAVNEAVPEILGLKNARVFPKDGSFRDDKWIADLPIFRTPDWQAANFVLTGNVNSVQTFRKVLRQQSYGKASAKGYWLEGKKGL